ncbi:DUF397 domain-containing protein [Streptomyces sp. CA-210063]|uniref:DUF397 domain-containing protein n=1 Tax=Streptomyces sp. CA-210063 TaxID=2801029 RepID=UPI00214CA00A|nr:DUF397 domain-containing protein [Streptomyces sp. CA-210063]UUU30944.1 DUF397 domain-containing protein [Streptomyces sp. CA-210063]
MSEIAWLKSSFSGQGDGASCLELAWRKSSHSGSGGNNCVELGTAYATLALRESDTPTVVLHTHRPQLTALLDHIKAHTPTTHP